MKPAFLSLDQLTVQRILIQSLEEHDPEADFAQASQTVKVAELARSDENQALWKVAIEIRVRPKKGHSPPPYRIEVDLAGIFSVGPSARNDLDLARLVGVNGASILYSAAREHVFLITSRGAWGSMQLPTVSFTDLRVEPLPPGGMPELPLRFEEATK